MAIAHSNVFQGIASLWKKRDEESMRDGPPHFCRLTRILSLSTIQFPETMDGDLRRKMALNFLLPFLEGYDALGRDGGCFKE